MRMVDIIEKKEKGLELSEEEIRFFVEGFCGGTVPDYQAAALLMAIFLKNMTPEETAVLTRVMAASGGTIDLSAISGVKVDKHSTGGIGDKTTLIVGPLVAACGGTVAKMSGRALGVCGGTIDKLESVPGFRVELSEEEFVRNVNELGLSVMGQTADVAPADKKLYALRDVTATIASTPLIASSVMSKKLASGADCFVLEVTVGSGAFVATVEEAKALAETMVEIGTRNGKPTVALITNMDRPLGRRIGNLLEVQEAAAVLRCEGPADVEKVCLHIAAEMLHMAGLGEREDCYARAEKALRSGGAYEKFLAFLRRQGGDPEVLTHPERFYPEPLTETLYADRDGYLATGNAGEIGRASMMMGAGRATKEDAIDFTAGISLAADVGAPVKKGDPLCTAYARDREKLRSGLAVLKEHIFVSETPVAKQPHIYARVGGGDGKGERV